MKIGLLPLSSDVDKRDLELKFISDIKNFLKDKNIESFEYSDKENFDFVFFLVVTGGSEKNFLKIKDNIKPPYIFIANKYNNSLPATIEINAYLEGKGRVFLWDKKSEKKDLIRTLNVLKIKDEFKEKRFGLIGNPNLFSLNSSLIFKTFKVLIKSFFSQEP